MIVVTGAAGFIGSVLVAHLNQQGHDDLLLVDALGQDDKYRNLLGLRYADYLHKDDFLARIEGRGGSLPEIEAMAHLGACSSTLEQDTDYLMRNNFGYTRSLALWSVAHDVRFVYASSAATYGDGSHGYGESLDALDMLRPLNKYGFSKHCFDLWALRHRLFGQIAGLKYFNVFGPNEYHKQEMRSVVLKAFQQVQAGGAVSLFKSYRPEYGDGHQERDFIYVKDAVAMTAWLLEHADANGIFNVGSGRARTWLDLARAVYAALGQPPQIRFVDMPEPLRDAYQYSTCAVMRRLAAAGCPVQSRPLEDGVRDYVQNYLVQPERPVAL
ncbi:MAG: ADP-glyceromanno-heptose 6-epimerase [Terriglobales bacterium]